MMSIMQFFPVDRSLAVQTILAQNALCARHGLSLTEAEAERIAEVHAVSLRDNGLFEIGAGSVEGIIEEFVASPYLHRENFAGVVEGMTEALFWLKREAGREIGDRTLIAAMRAMFDGSSQGAEELFFGRDLEQILRTLQGRPLEEEEDGDPGDAERRGILNRFFSKNRLPEGEMYEPDAWEEEYRVELDDL